MEERRAAGLLDHRLEILELALGRILRCIAGVATAAAIVVEDGEVHGEAARKLARPRIECSVLKGAANQDDRWPFGRAIECDRCAIRRGHFVDVPPSVRSGTSAI
jgi:hypothetical protein